MSNNCDGNETLWHVFVETVDRCEDREAFVQGDQRTSFAELQRRAEDVGAWLEGSGAVPGDRVLVCLEASAEMASVVLGVWAAGCIPILMDAGERGPYLDHAIEMAEPVVVIRPSRIVLPELCSAIDVVGTGEIGEVGGSFEPQAAVDESAAASILFTSGSTGRPKGVTQSHGSLIRGCRTVAGYMELRSTDRIVCAIPWSFDYGYGQLLTTLLTGLTQVLPTTPDPTPLCEAIATHRPTVFPGIPSLFTYLLRGPVPFRDLDLSCLRIVTNTGGTIPEPLLHEMFNLFGHCEIYLNYGLTESYRTSFLDPSLARTKPTSIGKTLPGVDVCIVTEEGQLAEPGEVGEIVHRGDYLFKEYWNDVEATAQALRPDPLAASGDPAPPRALFTGDLGSMDEEGFLYFHGRRDRQVKSMGVRVNPSAIEELLHASGLVSEVAVFGRPNDLIGQEVWAAVVPKEVDPTLARRLGAYAHRAMSKYMKPRRYLVKDALPKTPTGKVDYLALEAEAEQLPTAALLR